MDKSKSTQNKNLENIHTGTLLHTIKVPHILK